MTELKSVVKTGSTTESAVRLALEELKTTIENVDIKVIQEPKSGLFGLFGSKEAQVEVTLKEQKSIDSSIDDSEIKENIEELSEIIENDEEYGENLDLNQDDKESDIEECTESIVESNAATLEVEDTLTDKVKIAGVELSNIEYNSESLENKELDNNISEIDNKIVDFALLWLENILEKMQVKADVEIEYDGETLNADIINVNSDDTGIIIGARAETLNSIQYLLNVTVNKLSSKHVFCRVDVANYRARRKLTIENLAKRSAEKVKRFKRTVYLEPMSSYERRIVHCTLQDEENIVTTSVGKEPFRKIMIKYVKHS